MIFEIKITACIPCGFYPLERLTGYMGVRIPPRGHDKEMYEMFRS
jgi:hypothetical protein